MTYVKSVKKIIKEQNLKLTMENKKVFGDTNTERFFGKSKDLFCEKRDFEWKKTKSDK